MRRVAGLTDAIAGDGLRARFSGGCCGGSGCSAGDIGADDVVGEIQIETQRVLLLHRRTAEVSTRELYEHAGQMN